MATSHTVFVYGTLKKGEPNHCVLSETLGFYEAQGCAVSVDAFPLVVGTRFNIPFMLNKRGEGHRIQGELYVVDDAKLKVLDDLEAHPLLYTRTEEKFIRKDGSIVTAMVYMITKWRDDFLENASPLLEAYSSLGSHGRPYVDRYAREKLMQDEKSNLFIELMGHDPRTAGELTGLQKNHSQ